MSVTAISLLESIEPNNEIGDFLRHVPLLGLCFRCRYVVISIFLTANRLKNDAHFGHLGGAMIAKSFQAGENVVTQGEMGDTFYIIKQVKSV